MAERDGVPVVMSVESFRQEEIRRSREEAATLRLDEAEVPGGKFLAEDGETFVDANGVPLGDRPRLVSNEMDALRKEVEDLRAQIAAGSLPPTNENLEPGLSQGNLNEEQRATLLAAAAAEAAARTAAESGQPQTVDESQTVDELRKQADAMGVDLSGVKNKADLVARMNARLAGQ